MANYTVTTTQDTDVGVTPAPADIAGSLRAAVDSANAAGGGAIGFALPAGSTIALLSGLPDLTGTSSIDFTGAPNLTLTSATTGSTPGPYGALAVDGALTLSGTVTADTNTGELLAVTQTGSVTLSSGAALIGNGTSTSYPTLIDAGVSVAIGANARVTAVAGNALVVTQSTGPVANQTVSIAAGATVSDTSSADPTVYVSGSAQGAVVTNSGTLSATVNNTYNAASSSSYSNASTLVNTSSGVITDSSTGNNAAVVLTGASALQNAGMISQTGNSNAVYNPGTGAVTNTGAFSSATGVAYYASAASTLTNSGTITSTQNIAYEAGNNTAPGAATLVNASGGVITASNGVAVYLTGTATLQNAGQVNATGGYNAVYDTGTGSITNSGRMTSAGAAVVYMNAETLTNSGTIANMGTGSNGPGVVVGGAGVVVNSGSITTASSNGYAVGLQQGASLTSTGVISASSNTNYAVATFATSGAQTVTLGAGSTTTGFVGGTSGAALAITVAGSLNGGVTGGAEADTLTLVNGLTFTGAVNLGGGGDVLTLAGTSGANTLSGANVSSAVSLVKSGAGAWTLSGAGANYTGVALNGGTLELAAANSAGAGAITFGAGSQTLRLDLTAGANYALPNVLTGFGADDLIDVRGATVASTSVSGDTLTLTTTAGATAAVTFATGTLAGQTVTSGTDNAGGSYVAIGAALAPPAVAPGQTTNLDSSNSTVVNGDVTDSGTAQVGGSTPVTYTGSISGTGSVAVSGGTVTFTGNSTYTGATSISSGTLLVNGSIANSPVSVGTGGVLGGSGTTGAVTAASGATVSPGNSPGVLTTTGDLVLAAGSTLKEEIGGLANTSGLTTFDQIKVTGAVMLNGAALNTVLYGGFTPAASGTAPIVIIDNDGVDPVVGTFANLPEGSVFTVGGQQVKISYVGGTGNDVTLQFVGSYTAPGIGTGATLTASQTAGYTVQTDNLLRASPSDAGFANTASPIYGQAQAEAQIAAQLDTGQLSAQDAQSALFHLVDGTVSVAEISYAFFTGRTPTAAGLNYLVNSPANPTDLNDAYYAKFSTENRYINFAVNLATGSGAGAAAFQAGYGALSLNDATAKAYQAVFGTTASADKIAAILNTQVSNGLGGTETRAQYFSDISGGSPLAQKAAVAGFLLADSVKEGFGVYQQADLHFLQDLAHGTAAFGIDLLAAYAQAPSLVGRPVADLSLGG